MSSVEQAELAVLDELRTATDTLPKTVINRLQQRADLTDALVAEAIWRLVATHRVQLTKSLRLAVCERVPEAAEQRI